MIIFKLKKLIETSLDLKLESTSTNASSNDNGVSSITSRIPLENQRLKGTSYYYQTDKIVHFTSMQNLFSIINEGSVRLYNLNNSNDSEEYIHAANLLNDIYRLQNFNETRINKKIEEIKEYSFILSSTSIEFLGQKKFWEKYADCGKGVALEFEIIDDISNWENFYCSKVHFNEAHKFDLLIKEWNSLQKKVENIHYDIKLH